MQEYIGCVLFNYPVKRIRIDHLLRDEQEVTVTKDELQALVCYVAILQFDEKSNLKLEEKRSLRSVSGSDEFMDYYLYFYLFRFLDQFDTNLSRWIDNYQDKPITVNKLLNSHSLNEMIFEHVINKISFIRELELGKYLLRNYASILNRFEKGLLQRFYKEAVDSKIDFSDFFFNRLDGLNFLGTNKINPYDIEMVLLAFQYKFEIPIDKKRCVMLCSYLLYYHGLGRQRRIHQFRLFENILNFGLDLTNKRMSKPDQPIQPKTTRKKGPKR